jgi:hypothetical protein
MCEIPIKVVPSMMIEFGFITQLVYRWLNLFMWWFWRFQLWETRCFRVPGRNWFEFLYRIIANHKTQIKFWKSMGLSGEIFHLGRSRRRKNNYKNYILWMQKILLCLVMLYSTIDKGTLWNRCWDWVNAGKSS